MDRQLEWYRYLVHNKTVLGSLFTLIHLPLMLAFLSLVVIGAALVEPFNKVVLFLALAVVALLLYGEHVLDDLTRVGKPWNTALTDRQLSILASFVFTMAAVIGLYASIRFDTVLPLIGVVMGVMFCVLYGMEIWRFHEVVFGALGMGAVLPMSYLAQMIITGSAIDYSVLLLGLVAGFIVGYLTLWLYEQTKTASYRLMWRLLAIELLSVYSIAVVTLALWYTP